MKHEQEPLAEVDIDQLGEEVANDPTLDGFERQGRPLTNLEMYAARKYRQQTATDILENL